MRQVGFMVGGRNPNWLVICSRWTHVRVKMQHGGGAVVSSQQQALLAFAPAGPGWYSCSAHPAQGVCKLLRNE